MRPGRQRALPPRAKAPDEPGSGGVTESSPVALVVGLGNPGERYERTRHNAGFWLVDVLASGLGADFRAERRFNALVASVRIGDRPIPLLKPMTFMNRSGQAVGAFARYYHIAPEQVLVAHDEIDLPPGTVRLKRGGGAGGHNGLRDIISAFGGNAEFLRLRIGVGRPGPGSAGVVDFVLRTPPSAERKLIDDSIERALDVVPLIVGGDTGRAMQRLHTRAPDAPPP